MKKLKNENGAITIIVLVSVLFMVSFLISTYVIVANKVQTQKEVIQEIRRIYEPERSLDEIYNSYFSTEDIIPIYNEEQLLLIGKLQDNVNINGKYYNFTNNPDTIYILMNDIELNAYDYEENVKTWENVDFEGNNRTITVNYKDEEDDEYEIVYSNENNYQEPIYEVEIKAFTQNGADVTDNAQIYLKNGQELVQLEKNENNKYVINVARLQQTEIIAKLTEYNDAEETIYIENPDKKDDEIDLVLGQFLFTINPTPANATVRINNQVRNNISVAAGTIVDWSVEADEYITQNGTYTVQSDNEVQNVSLNVKTYVYTITVNVPDSTVTLSNQTHSNYTQEMVSSTQYRITAQKGDTIAYNVSKNYYVSQSGTDSIATTDKSKSITLVQKESNTLTINPDSVSSSGSFKTAASNANKGVDVNTSTYARATGDSYLQWNFTSLSAIDNNALIQSISIDYRIAAAWSMGASVEIKAGTTTCLSKNYDSVYSNLVAGSQKYTDSATTLPTGSQAKSGISLKVTKGNKSDSYHFRWYGATLTITYINP